MLLRVRLLGLFIAPCFSCIHFESDSEERAAGVRLEGWATGAVCVWPMLRDGPSGLLVSKDDRTGVELQVRSRWTARRLLGLASPFLSSLPPPLIL